jgi:hypothetical protein
VSLTLRNPLHVSTLAARLPSGERIGFELSLEAVVAMKMESADHPRAASVSGVAIMAVRMRVHKGLRLACHISSTKRAVNVSGSAIAKNSRQLMKIMGPSG